MWRAVFKRNTGIAAAVYTVLMYSVTTSERASRDPV
jgi:hypothetical protein